MSTIGLVVTVRFHGEAARHDQVLRDHPDLARAIAEATERHHLVRSTRLVGDGVFMDIDEWEREEHRDAFVAEMRPWLLRWNDLAGVTGMVSETWRPGEPGPA
jgi:hypothetical protein